MPTLKELKILADELGVQGSSWMNKDYLMAAIQNQTDMKAMSSALLCDLKNNDMVKIWGDSCFGVVISVRKSYYDVYIRFLNSPSRYLRQSFYMYKKGKFLEAHIPKNHLSDFLIRNGVTVKENS